MLSLNNLLAVAAVGVLVATPALAQVGGGTTGGTGGGTGGGIVPAPGTTMPPSASPPLNPSSAPTPPRPGESTRAPGIDNPTGAIPGTLGSTPSGAPNTPSTTLPPSGIDSSGTPTR
jgi:hypothetical protein